MVKQEHNTKADILNDLPQEIQGFKRRIITVNNSSTIMYSKDGNLLLKNIKHSETRIKDLSEFSKNLLYEVTANTLEDCVAKMKSKIELNQKVTSDFPKNVIIGFSSNYKITIEKVDYHYKLFEVYLVLDTNSDSQFFSVVTINPLFDLTYILGAVNDIKKQIKSQTLIKLSTEEFDYSEFNLPTTIHLYSNDFHKKKDDILKYFKSNNWNVKFRDKYFFEKQRNAIKNKIILCEGKNVKMLNDLDLKNILFSMEHNSISIFQNIKTDKIYALRDKDYLLREEVNRIKLVFKKYSILEYYCIENYLYHPDNLQELNIKNFNKNAYIDDIREQKELNLLSIISDFKGIRKGYKELRENHINISKDADRVFISELSSKDFEVFYQHFDMKGIYRKDFLQNLNLTETKLSSTKWFKTQIENVIREK